MLQNRPELLKNLQVLAQYLLVLSHIVIILVSIEQVNTAIVHTLSDIYWIPLTTYCF